MGQFDGILICTDLDGTLLKKDKSISSENVKAIEFFKKMGDYLPLLPDECQKLLRMYARL